MRRLGQRHAEGLRAAAEPGAFAPTPERARPGWSRASFEGIGVRGHYIHWIDRILMARGAPASAYTEFYALVHADQEDLDAVLRDFDAMRARPLTLTPPDEALPEGHACVYFIRERERGQPTEMLKIGRSAEHPRAGRLGELQTCNPRELFLEARVPVDPERMCAMESALQGYFAPWAVRGEWFEISSAGLRRELALLQHAGGLAL